MQSEKTSIAGRVFSSREIHWARPSRSNFTTKMARSFAITVRDPWGNVRVIALLVSPQMKELSLRSTAMSAIQKLKLSG